MCVNSIYITELLCSIYLGMCPNMTDDSTVCSKHASSFTDFNLWDHALSKELMLEWTKCSPTQAHGNVVDWRTARWNLVNTSILYNVSYVDVICQFNQRPGLTFFPTR